MNIDPKQIAKIQSELDRINEQQDTLYRAILEKFGKESSLIMSFPLHEANNARAKIRWILQAVEQNDSRHWSLK